MKPLEKHVYLSSPTMHKEEFEYMKEAYDTNWMSTVGKNIDEVERIAAEKAGMEYAVGLSCCTAALHLACTDSGAHAEILLYCIEKGVNAIVEKPMTMSMEDAEEVVRRSEEIEWMS